MKKILFSFLILCISFCAIAQNNARVIRVKDGDTYVLKTSDSNTITIRLARIDAPELKQTWGFEAMQNVSELILGKEVSYQRVSMDRYGRMIAYIFIDGQSLDEILVRNGWAWHYITYDNDQRLDDLMREASEQHIGLWECGKENVCPPWLFRQYNKINRARFCKGCQGF